jgi:hypothetical protein
MNSTVKTSVEDLGKDGQIYVASEERIAHEVWTSAQARIIGNTRFYGRLVVERQLNVNRT